MARGFLSCFFVLVSILGAGSAAAQQNGTPNPIDVRMAQCLDKKENQTTAGMCDCVYTALAAWDKKLNTDYKSLLAQLPPAAKGKLIAAQRQWLAFKEKELELIGATYGNAQGTMWQPVRANKIMDLTKQRALELEELLVTLKEF
ncbi:DUF1311 domain-containing protein [Rufibacter immobilis]|uniref:DUF1311 domain-containing protein n=1 Tax=Rufibacter immobilis TaxID=1348778 RepID=A0A3M9MXL1_9BACT|nr:lysozyme inhibitor LprI family protein [Rufibacter immobilis]RNI30274.1 DUF1311 domain-containing protein [Rufibacter immobilis]